MSAPTQYSSHAALLKPLRPGTFPLGGIVIPAVRPPSELMTAARLAASLDVPAVFLCSGQARPYEIIERAEMIDGARCFAIDMVTMRAYADLPVFETEEFTEAVDGAYGDLSLKRNLGLLIARLADWKTLLFLDDDIFGLSAAKVKRAAGALEHVAVVGMPATEFPDNSVVCHARRLVDGEQQDVFVSGSALAVNVERADSFFPPIYNEDWLFLAQQVDKRAIARNHVARQLPYYPFDSPRRAERQEFGDVLAEGLIGHLHTSRLAEPPTLRYWRAFLRKREELIETAIRSCEGKRENPAARDAIVALKRAERTRSKIDPRTLVQYVTAWQKDLTRWSDHLQELSPVGSLDKALAQLGLLSSAMATSAALSILGPPAPEPLLDASSGRVSLSRQ